MDSFPGSKGSHLVRLLARAIHENAQELSDLDGLIGDGDHGINMNKGFALAAKQMAGELEVSDAFQALGRVLLEEIGGAMGPLYGSFFRAMARAARGKEAIDAATFSSMLHGAGDKVREIGGAEVGDKTLLDTLAPAAAAFDRAVAEGGGFGPALVALERAAAEGRDATKLLVARKGRASRLGERSRGSVDAGAASCCVILTALAGAIRDEL